MAKPTIKELQAQIAVLKAQVETQNKIKEGLADSASLLELFNNKLSVTNVAMKALDAAGIATGTMTSRFIDLTEALNKSSAGVDQLKLSKEALRDSLFDLSKETREFGVSIDDNYKITRDFTQQNVKLLDIYKKNTVGLVDFASRLKAFGVDTKDAYEMVGTLTSNLDMNANQLDSTRRSLVGFARQTGQSVQEVVKSYTTNIKSFMDFLDPKEMNQAFMQFQVMSRRMGMEANKLYGIATKFDTIEQSQEIGARLNQVFSSLGIEFNALALQEMDPKQRVEYLSTKTREALTRARGMGGMEGRLITQALTQAGGFGSVADLRAFAAEGGGRRAGAFERGGGRVAEVSRREEALIARRENIVNLQRANTKIMTETLARQTRFFRSMTSLVDNFPNLIMTAVEKEFELKMRAQGRLLAGEIPEAIKAVLENNNIAVSNLSQAVVQLGKVVETMGLTDKQKRDLLASISGLPTSVGLAIKAAMGVV